MKDPHDDKTLDAITHVKKDDLRQFLQHFETALKSKPGRKPMGEKALTKAEKQKAYRDRKRAKKEAIQAGEPVKSEIIDLETSFKIAKKIAR